MIDAEEDKPFLEFAWSQLHICLTCIPVLWVLNSSRTSAWQSTVTVGYSSILAGFNE